MDEAQVFRLWIILGTFSLVLLLVGALSNIGTVYRDDTDFGWSLGYAFSSVIGFIVIVFIAGDQTDPWFFATSSIAGAAVVGFSGLISGLPSPQTYRFSVLDNGLLSGLLIGIRKLVIAALIIVSAIGLLRYLFKETRRFGHIAIFFMPSGVFGWFVNTLVNGARTGEVLPAPGR